MYRVTWPCALLVMFGWAMATVLSAATADRPNVIFILADDLGFTDLGCQGSNYYETPSIDRLPPRACG